METIYKILEEKQKSRPSFEKSEEYKFFLKNRHILDKLPRFAFLYESEGNYFDVMRANIILYSYLNKETIEKEISSLKQYENKDHDKFVELLKEKIVDLPSMTLNEQKIYIPFFPKALNNMYVEEPEKLTSFPFNELVDKFEASLIDPFDVYGYGLYNTPFTRLVLIKENPNHKEAAFFHYDTMTIYFINDQGRLDDKLVLFDKYIKRPNDHHIIERITPIIDAYFAFDRTNMIEALHDNDFISGKLMSILRKTFGDSDEI